MRLRRRADLVRGVGWVNLMVALILAALDSESWLALLIAAAGIMCVMYGLAYLLDRRADHVVGR